MTRVYETVAVCILFIIVLICLADVIYSLFLVSFIIYNYNFKSSEYSHILVYFPLVAYLKILFDLIRRIHGIKSHSVLNFFFSNRFLT